jgi:hypothetical protein
MISEVRKQRQALDLARAVECFKELLGKGVEEWELRKENYVLRPERRW